MAVANWLQGAATGSGTSISFGSDSWLDMHGGKTSKFPHCRPQGLYNPKNKTWNVRLFWQPLNPKPTILIESFTHKERKERLMNQIFSPSQSQPQITYLTNFISTNPNHLHQKKDEKREMKSIIVLYPISSDMTKKN